VRDLDIKHLGILSSIPFDALPERVNEERSLFGKALSASSFFKATIPLRTQDAVFAVNSRTMARVGSASLPCHLSDLLPRC